eukprot:359827-Chlamydomonas_euryale.AAC.1
MASAYCRDALFAVPLSQSFPLRRAVAGLLDAVTVRARVTGRGPNRACLCETQQSIKENMQGQWSAPLLDRMSAQATPCIVFARLHLQHDVVRRGGFALSFALASTPDTHF